jgi:hypothetical protein
MKKTIFFTIAIIFSILLVSCGGSRVIVTERPAVPYYQRPLAPRANYIWVDGDWIIRNGRYTYRQGYWAAPRQNRRWQNGYWQHGNRGWNWNHGYWRRY